MKGMDLGSEWGWDRAMFPHVALGFKPLERCAHCAMKSSREFVLQNKTYRPAIVKPLLFALLFLDRRSVICFLVQNK